LENTDKSPKANIDAFDRLRNDPTAPHRVILLVNKGTEGWNCPSLFACALARRLKNSNNFVLQAASRCLRQVPGNTHKAAIYLSRDNLNTLDKELQETYGESIADLKETKSKSKHAIIQLRKINLPPLVVKQIVRTVALLRKANNSGFCQNSSDFKFTQFKETHLEHI
jgi:type III restriction enzyme